MHPLKSAKIYFFFAVLLLVAKPFLGFTMFSRMHPPSNENIFVKAFLKRKQEYVENSKFDMIAIQKKLADPVEQFFLRFSFLLSILFPLIFEAGVSAVNRFMRNAKLTLTSGNGETWLLNRQLIIWFLLVNRCARYFQVYPGTPDVFDRSTFQDFFLVRKGAFKRLFSNNI